MKRRMKKIKNLWSKLISKMMWICNFQERPLN